MGKVEVKRNDVTRSDRLDMEQITKVCGKWVYKELERK